MAIGHAKKLIIFMVVLDFERFITRPIFPILRPPCIEKTIVSYIYLTLRFSNVISIRLPITFIQIGPSVYVVVMLAMAWIIS